MTETEFIAQCERRGLNFCYTDEDDSSIYVPDANDYDGFFYLYRDGESFFGVQHVLPDGKLGLEYGLELHDAINMVWRSFWRYKTGDAVPNFVAEMDR